MSTTARHVSITRSPIGGDSPDKFGIFTAEGNAIAFFDTENEAIGAFGRFEVDERSTLAVIEFDSRGMAVRLVAGDGVNTASVRDDDSEATR